MNAPTKVEVYLAIRDLEYAYYKDGLTIGLTMTRVRARLSQPVRNKLVKVFAAVPGADTIFSRANPQMFQRALERVRVNMSEYDLSFCVE